MDSLRKTLVVFCLFCVSAAHAAELYMVTGVTTDVTADDTMHLRDTAIVAAERKAFINLATQLLPAGPIPNPSDAAIAGMISDLKVEKEQFSANHYVGTLTFRFRQNPVRMAFGDHAILSPSELYAQQNAGTAPNSTTQISSEAAAIAPVGDNTAPMPMMNALAVNGPQQMMLIQVPPESMQKMAVAPEMIRTAAGVSKIEFRSVAPTRAVMAMTYQGETAAIVQTLAQRGVNLQPAAAGAQPPVYTLLP